MMTDSLSSITIITHMHRQYTMTDLTQITFRHTTYRGSYETDFHNIALKLILKYATSLRFETYFIMSEIKCFLKNYIRNVLNIFYC